MTSPVIIAAIGAVLSTIAYFLSGRIKNEYWRGSAQIGSIVFGLLIASSLSGDTKVAAASGQYYFFIMIAVAALAKIFGKKQSNEVV